MWSLKSVKSCKWSNLTIKLLLSVNKWLSPPEPSQTSSKSQRNFERTSLRSSGDAYLITICFQIKYLIWYKARSCNKYNMSSLRTNLIWYLRASMPYPMPRILKISISWRLISCKTRSKSYIMRRLISIKHLISRLKIKMDSEMILKILLISSRSWSDRVNSMWSKQRKPWTNLMERLGNSPSTLTKLSMKEFKLKKPSKIWRQKEKRWSSGLSSSKTVKERLISVSKCAEYATKNSMRKRTSTGVAGLIRVPMEVRCGGAAEREAKTSLDASFPSMSQKRMMMKKMMIMIRKRIRQSSWNIRDASAVKKWAIRLITVHEIQI